ncbi:NF038129 family PEP-CTERM protein [Paucibacter sp. B2R-40]|uniref:NF038129 family PEP-CTERM protein n=1 Tax=Paucibacter sp. B2R-40 TaxID=2893554 RepID=UPI0021E3F63F|nr:NF038129 family PEP-CTERM protein [Paucibacter sp. B2R-40]MCV2353759.1 NF038129 family PEP-CTERM protein [Paucibacter sp. B2R-40]
MNISTISKSNLAHSLLALALAASAGLARAETFHAEINTAAFAASSGWLDIQFNPGSLPAVGTTVSLSNFSGSFGAAQVLEGDVAGSLASGFVLGNTSSYNDLFQAVNLGGKFGFDISFGGAFASTAGNVGTSFAVGLLGFDQTSYLGNPDGNLFKIELMPMNLNISPEILNNSITTVTAAVPEPASYALLLGGLALLVGVTRRRQAR